jgi:hypothetical protein
LMLHKGQNSAHVSSVSLWTVFHPVGTGSILIL